MQEPGEEWNGQDQREKVQGYEAGTHQEEKDKGRHQVVFRRHLMVNQDVIECQCGDQDNNVRYDRVVQLG